MDLPNSISWDIGPLCAELVARGFAVDVLSVGSMHSYQVSVSGPLVFIITADRGQLFLEGDKKVLEAEGLWRAFDNYADFSARVLRFVETGSQDG